MDEQAIDNYEQMMGQAAITGQVQRNASEASQYYLEEKEKGIIDIQLEVDSIKSDIYHLIRQDIQKTKMDGTQEWKELKDNKQRILSDWGVDRIMQIIHFYINKNTLLSNFSEEQINRLMLRFIRELNDLILLKYQVIFREPTFEECKKIILDKLDNRQKMRIFAMEIIEKKADKEEIKKELLYELEKTIDKEMEKTRNEQRKEKLRDYGLIIAQLEIMVYSTLNRAFRGEERGSLRRHMNVSELIGTKPTPMDKEKGGFFGWGRK